MVEETKTTKILDNLPSFMDKSGNNKDFITSFDEGFQNTQDNIELLKQGIQISTATGTDLDDIGYLFSLDRFSGEADILYRARIKSFWQSNKKGGTNDNILSAVSILLGLEKTSIEVNESILSFDLTITIPEDFDFSVAENLLKTVTSAKAAGIYFGGLNCTSWDSEDNKFLVNFSKVNGENTLL